MDFNNLPQQCGESKQETLNWLQNTYLVDSNVDSGVVTGAPSTHDYEDEMETDLINQDLMEVRSGRYVPSQSSITSTVLSDMIDENRRFSRPQARDNFSTGYATPNSGISSNYIPQQSENNKQEPTSVVSELITLLNDEDEVVVSQAVKMVSESAQREGSRQAIMNSLELIAAVARIMSCGHDLETTKTAIKTLHHLSHHKEGLVSICRSGAIDALVKLLGVESVLFYAITTIHNLLLRLDMSKVQVRAAGGVQKMVMLLRKDNLKFLTVVTDCLHLLTLGHQESKAIVLHCNGPAELVRIIQTYTYEKLLWTATRVLKVLSVCSNNKQAIIAAGGMQALAMHLNYPNCTGSSRLLQTILWTLRNLSDAATKVGGLEELLYSLVNLLQASDEHVITCTVGILSNLTCNNQFNKLTVFQAGGIEALIQTIRNAGDREDITEPSICALRHLTWKHSESEAAQSEIRRIFGIPVIANLFQPSSSWPLIKAVVGLIRNLAQNTENHITLRDQGVIQQLVGLLNHASQSLQEKNGIPNGGNNAAIVEGVRMEEIIEASISALSALARDPQNKNIIQSQQVIPLLAQLMLGNNANITRVAAEVLCELTQERREAEFF